MPLLEVYTIKSTLPASAAKLDEMRHYGLLIWGTRVILTIKVREEKMSLVYTDDERHIRMVKVKGKLGSLILIDIELPVKNCE